MDRFRGESLMNMENISKNETSNERPNVIDNTQPSTILVCENSLEGVFSAIFKAYLLKKPHENIHIQTEVIDNYSLLSEYEEVMVNEEWVNRVSKKLEEAFGFETFMRLCGILVPDVTVGADILYHVAVFGLRLKRPDMVFEQLYNPWVLDGFKLWRRASREIQHMKGFLRFEELKSGILFSKINPKGDLLLFITEHFSDRFPGENFVIYDEIRHKCVVHPAFEQWYLRTGIAEEELNIGEKSEREEYFSRLFQEFVSTIGIESRRNPDLQRNMLPLYFRKNMVEFAAKR